MRTKLIVYSLLYQWQNSYNYCAVSVFWITDKHLCDMVKFPLQSGEPDWKKSQLLLKISSLSDYVRLSFDNQHDISPVWYVLDVDLVTHQVCIIWECLWRFSSSFFYPIPFLEGCRNDLFYFMWGDVTF